MEEEFMAGDAPRNYAGIVGLLVVLLLVGVALLVIRNLGAATRAQDCLMQGRQDCNAVISTTR